MAKGSLLVVALAALVCGDGAAGAYPGANGRIAFVRHLEERAYTTDPGSIWSVRADGTDERRLTRSRWGDSEPAWSPDGRRIVFVRKTAESALFPNDVHELFVMRADGSGLRRLTRNSVAESSPTWSRDGRRLYFVRSESPGAIRRPSADVWTIPAGGGRARRVARTDVVERGLTAGPRGLAFLAAWPERWFHPVEGVAYWQLSEQRELWTMRLDGKGAHGTGITSTTFRPSLVFAGHQLAPPSWSPGGGRVALASWGRVYSMRPDGTDVLVHGAGEASAWSPDGRELATVRTGEIGGAIFVLSATESQERRVTTDTFERERAFDSDPDWQPLRR